MESRAAVDGVPKLRGERWVGRIHNDTLQFDQIVQA
jgi:hypothetical protein